MVTTRLLHLTLTILLLIQFLRFINPSLIQLILILLKILNFETFLIFQKQIPHSLTFLKLKQVVLDLPSLLRIIHLQLLFHLLYQVSILEATWKPTNHGFLLMLFLFLVLNILCQNIKKRFYPNSIPIMMFYQKIALNTL